MLVQVPFVLVGLQTVPTIKVSRVWVELPEVLQQLGLVGEALGAAAAGVLELLQVTAHVLDQDFPDPTAESAVQALVLSLSSV